MYRLRHLRRVVIYVGSPKNTSTSKGVVKKPILHVNAILFSRSPPPRRARFVWRWSRTPSATPTSTPWRGTTRRGSSPQSWGTRPRPSWSRSGRGWENLIFFGKLNVSGRVARLTRPKYCPLGSLISPQNNPKFAFSSLCSHFTPKAISNTFYSWWLLSKWATLLSPVILLPLCELVKFTAR